MEIVWFILLGVLLAGYAVLDGFDLGVGILHLTAKSDEERRIHLNAIGPIWDGNEVWLITFGGALFAAFPLAYATVFSGFYIAFMLLLFALILRGVSIEFRSKLHAPRWRAFWDWGFFKASLLATLLFGVGVGNAMRGIALDERGVFTGGFFSLLNPYAVCVGLMTCAMFALHGALYLNLKVPHGPMQQRVERWIFRTWALFAFAYLAMTAWTLFTIPRATANFVHFPWAFAIVALNVFAAANILRATLKGRPLQAFLSSVVTILALVSLLGLALYPNLVTAANNPAFSLTITNAASSPGTLKTMLIIAAIGLPFVLTYSAAIYWTFRGRVKMEGESGY